MLRIYNITWHKYISEWNVKSVALLLFITMSIISIATERTTAKTCTTNRPVLRLVLLR